MTDQLELFRPWQLRPAGPVVEHGYTETWGVAITHPGGWKFLEENEVDECQPTVLSKDLRCNCWGNHRGPASTFEKCYCVGDLMYRGACRKCVWEAPLMRSSEHLAVCDALDHSWPTWRNLPVYNGPIPEGSGPKHEREVTSWLAKMRNLGYPEGWIERGGPIRTRRAQMGTRPHTVHTGFGNYSVTGEVVGCSLWKGEKCQGVDACLTGRCVPFQLDGEDDGEEYA